MVDSTSELLKLTSQLQEKKISDSEFDAQSGPIRRSVEEARNKIKSEATMFVLDYPERKTPAVEKFLKQ